MVTILAQAKEAVSAAANSATPESGANQVMIFWITLGLLALFIAYFAIEKASPRRWVGTLLALGVSGLSLFFYEEFPMPLGIDLRGGVEFVLEIQQQGEKQIDAAARQQVIATLQRRLDAGGVTDLNMSPQGENRILLQMPGISEDERKVIRKTLETTAQLEIRLAHPQNRPELVKRVSEGSDFIAGYEVLPAYDQGTGNRQPLRIGEDCYGGSIFRGAISRVSVYQRGLKDDEVAKLAAGKPDDAATALDGRVVGWQFASAPADAKTFGQVRFGEQDGVKAALLEGGHLEVPGDAVAVLANSFTMEAWIWPDPKGSGDGRIFDKVTPKKDDGFYFDIQPHYRNLRFAVGRDLTTTDQAIAPGKWNHIAAAYDPIVGRRIYLNGKLLHSPESGGALVDILKVVDGTAVVNAFRSYGPQGFQINVKLDGKGGDKMFETTGRHKGEPMAIVVDNKIVSVATIKDRFGSDFIITGRFSQQEAENLATFLKNPLAKPIKIISESGVTAAMGKETIRQGIAAGLGGMLITLIFVLFYYRIAGLIAVAGLAVNVVIILGVMAMFPFVMTMPGIAGIVLTIGMSIDANVLIYERLREEQQAGKTLRAALDASYEKAFSAIFDSNITTLIAAFVLLWMAAGTIKGFAITLIIGVIGCLFAALLVTRVLFSWLLQWNWLKSMDMWGIVREPKIDFMKYRFRAIAVSLTVMAISIGVFFVKKGDALGVDLRGGDLVTIRSAESLSVARLEQSLAKANLKTTALVQQQKAIGQPAVFYTIRTADDDGDAALAHLRKDLGLPLPDTTLESIGSQVGSEMLTKSIWALALSMVGITIYLAIRFESMAFALGAIVALLHDVIAAAGLVVVFGHEITLIVVGAILTIAGYSVNDTIVIFDRIRDSLRTMRGDLKDIMNVSLNATLARTVITSGLTLQVVVVLYLFGGPSLKDFSLTLIIGMLAGVLSTVFVACPIVLWWAGFRKVNLRRELLDADAAKAGSPAASNQ